MPSTGATCTERSLLNPRGMPGSQQRGTRVQTPCRVGPLRAATLWPSEAAFSPRHGTSPCCLSRLLPKQAALHRGPWVPWLSPATSSTGGGRLGPRASHPPHYPLKKHPGEQLLARGARAGPRLGAGRCRGPAARMSPGYPRDKHAEPVRCVLRQEACRMLPDLEPGTATSRISGDWTLGGDNAL